MKVVDIISALENKMTDQDCIEILYKLTDIATAKETIFKMEKIMKDTADGERD